MSNIILIGAAGHQGSEYFELLNQRDNICALVDENFVALEKKYGETGLPLVRNLDYISPSINYDSAIVCVPHYLHKDITLKLISQGKTIIKEKPLGISSLDIDDYSKAMQNCNNYKLFTIVQREFNPSFIHGRQDISLIGEVYNYQYTYNLSVSKQTSGWRADFNKSFGGVLIDMGYHVLDIIFSIFQKPIYSAAVASYCYEDMKKEKLEDSICILMNHKNNISGTVILNRHSSKKEEMFRILGTNGSMEIRPNSYTIYDRNNNEIKRQIYPVSSEQMKFSMFASYLKLRSNEEFLKKHFEHHCNIVREIESIYTSIRSNQCELAA